MSVRWRGSVFDWDEGNEEHIAEHGLAPEDVEDAVLDPRRIGVPAYSVAGEQRRGLSGATGAGRILLVVVARRADLIRVVTAYDANEQQKRRYRRRGK